MIRRAVLLVVLAAGLTLGQVAVAADPAQPPSLTKADAKWATRDLLVNHVGPLVTDSLKPPAPVRVWGCRAGTPSRVTCRGSVTAGSVTCRGLFLTQQYAKTYVQSPTWMVCRRGK